MLPIIKGFFEHYSQLLQPILFLSAWLLFGFMLWTIVAAIVDVIKRSQTMHQIPCHSCRFCTKSHYLKCTIHPTNALTESAINCFDYRPQPSDYQS